MKPRRGNRLGLIMVRRKHLTKRLRRLSANMLHEILYRSGAIAYAKRRLRRASAIVVLTFHRVLEESQVQSSCSPHGMIVRLRTFEAAIRYLSLECGFVDLRDVTGRPSSRVRLAITFDDGWLDNAENAIPVLARAGIPSCIFICSDQMGKDRPYWPERALYAMRENSANSESTKHLGDILRERGLPKCRDEEEFVEFLKTQSSSRREWILSCIAQSPGAEASTCDRTMTWEDARLLKEQCVTFGNHTSTHEIVTSLTEEELQSQLAASKERMESELGYQITLFSYPNGTWTERSRELLSSCGYRYAFINEPGVWREDSDPFIIPRINISEPKLTGFDGRFSKAACEYFMFWMPYRNWMRSRGRSLPDACTVTAEVTVKRAAIDQGTAHG